MYSSEKECCNILACLLALLIQVPRCTTASNERKDHATATAAGLTIWRRGSAGSGGSIATALLGQRRSCNSAEHCVCCLSKKEKRCYEKRKKDWKPLLFYIFSENLVMKSSSQCCHRLAARRLSGIQRSKRSFALRPSFWPLLFCKQRKNIFPVHECSILLLATGTFACSSNHNLCAALLTIQPEKACGSCSGCVPVPSAIRRSPLCVKASSAATIPNLGMDQYFTEKKKRILNPFYLPCQLPDCIKRADRQLLNDAAADATRILKSRPSLAYLQRRPFSSSASSSISFRFVNHRRLLKLEQEANLFSQDAKRQAALYRV